MNWLRHLWFNYFWPSDEGNGPEAIQQTLLYTLAAVLLIPPVRKFIGAHIKSIHDKLDIGQKLARKHQAELLEQNQRHHEEALHIAKANHDAHMAALKPKPRTPRGTT